MRLVGSFYLDDLANLSRLTFTVSPAALEKARSTTITLRVRNLPLRNLLALLCRHGGLAWAPRSGGVWIHLPGEAVPPGAWAPPASPPTTSPAGTAVVDDPWAAEAPAGEPLDPSPTGAVGSEPLDPAETIIYEDESEVCTVDAGGTYDAGGPSSFGVPTVTFGAGGGDWPLGIDYVPLSQVVAEARVLTRLILDTLA